MYKGERKYIECQQYVYKQTKSMCEEDEGRYRTDLRMIQKMGEGPGKA